MTSLHQLGPLRHRTRAELRRKSVRGAAAVEFALVAPLLFFLFFGFVDVGRAIMVKNLLTSAARDAARTASLDGSTVSEVQAQATSFLSGWPDLTVNVTPEPLTSAQIGDPVSVNITVPFASVSWLPSSFYFGGLTLDSTVVMRRETN